MYNTLNNKMPSVDIVELSKWHISLLFIFKQFNLNYINVTLDFIHFV